MTISTLKAIITPVTSPITDFAKPLYHLVIGHQRKTQVEKLLLTTFRTATFAGFFFLVIPFNHAFGSQGNLSASLAMGAQWLIHPYAAAHFNAAISGGIFLVMQGADMISKRQFNFTREHAGPLALTVGFLYLAQVIKEHVLDYQYVDGKYRDWAALAATKICYS